MSLEASAGDFARAIATMADISDPNTVKVVRTAKDDIYSWTITFPARYGRASLRKVKSSCGDNFDGDYDFEFHSRNADMSANARYGFTADSWSGYDCNYNDTFTFTNTRVVPGSAVLDGTLSVTIQQETFIVPLREAASRLSSSC